jgi:hypothetical protein
VVSTSWSSCRPGRPGIDAGRRRANLTPDTRRRRSSPPEARDEPTVVVEMERRGSGGSGFLPPERIFFRT